MEMNGHPTRVGIVGANGYSGLELTRLLLNHSGARVAYVAASKEADGALAEEQPFLRQVEGLRVEQFDPDVCADACDVAFIGLPSGSSGQVAAQLYERGLRVIDLSGDLRLPAEDYRAWYGRDPIAASVVADAVYGLTEWRRAHVANARLIANPGCYATAALLALLPVVRAGLNRDAAPVVIDAKSGVSGAGRKATQSGLFGELSENFYPYKVGRHQHTPEVERQLSASGDLRVVLTTQLLPVVRGILAACYVTLDRPMSTEEVYEIYQKCYQDELFVRVHKPGRMPEIKHVRGSNYCDIGLQVDERTGHLQVFSVIDNLQKGAAGQAVQNFNVMQGYAEAEGLLAQPLYP